MARHVLARRAAITLAGAYLVVGVLETARVVVTGDGGLLFWFGTLVGGGALLLVGALPRREAPDARHAAAVLLGAVVGIPATAWTLLVPLLAVAVVVLTVLSLRDAAEPAR